MQDEKRAGSELGESVRRYAAGDLCPDCGTPMEFEHGDETVGIYEGIVCPNCEADAVNPPLHQVDWSRMPPSA